VFAGCATLSRSSHTSPPQVEPSTLYDSALEQRVRAYQRTHQLTVDGIVGARTQIAMLAELNLPTPRHS
jgi:peptidoglycan hydrolase-like protein with peptidoglycan-binding domain